MHILVTGAGGFVGPHLVAELLGANHKVSAIDRDVSRLAGLPLAHCEPIDLYDEPGLRRALTDWGADSIVHLAGWSHVGQSWKNPAEVIRLNVATTALLYSFASEVFPRGGRFLFISSADVYGQAKAEDLPLDENSETRPATPYGLSKLAAERLLLMQRIQSSVELIIARPFNHIGPGQSPTFVTPGFARQIAEIEAGRREVVMHGNLEPRRDFVDVRDVARAYRLLLEKGTDREIYTISSGQSHSMESLLLKLFALSGRPPAMRIDPTLARPVDVMNLQGSYDKLLGHTGWKPVYTMEQSLRDVLEEARSIVRTLP